jgi:hypothetical protein
MGPASRRSLAGNFALACEKPPLMRPWSLNPDAASSHFDVNRVVMLLPNGEPLTASEPRLIAEAGPFLRRALVDRDPELVSVYDDWTSQFEKRPFRLNPVHKARARN